MLRIVTTFLILGWCFEMEVVAQKDATEVYPAVFNKVVDNCKPMGLGIVLREKTISMATKGTELLVTVAELPTLRGKPSSRGKLRVEVKGKVRDGIRAHYGLNGRISNESLQAVFVAEYFKGDKPMCTQSWSVSGARKK